MSIARPLRWKLLGTPPTLRFRSGDRTTLVTCPQERAAFTAELTLNSLGLGLSGKPTLAAIGACGLLPTVRTPKSVAELPAAAAMSSKPIPITSPQGLAGSEAEPAT